MPQLWGRDLLILKVMRIFLGALSYFPSVLLSSLLCNFLVWLRAYLKVGQTYDILCY